MPAGTVGDTIVAVVKVVEENVVVDVRVVEVGIYTNAGSEGKYRSSAWFRLQQ